MRKRYALWWFESANLKLRSQKVLKCMRYFILRCHFLFLFRGLARIIHLSRLVPCRRCRRHRTGRNIIEHGPIM